MSAGAFLIGVNAEKVASVLTNKHNLAGPSPQSFQVVSHDFRWFGHRSATMEVHNNNNNVPVTIEDEIEVIDLGQLWFVAN